MPGSMAGPLGKENIIAGRVIKYSLKSQYSVGPHIFQRLSAGKKMLKEILKYFVLGYRYVILDIPLLFESKMLTRFMKHTVVVYCDPQVQLSRLMHRNGLTQTEAEARIFAQMPLAQKVKLADHVIDNSGDAETTKKQVLKLHTELEKSLEYLMVRLLAIGATVGVGGLIYFLVQQLV
ncbi:PREDICTED: dephospho-CoA kinase domain-containing protein-like [Thamnophis sirtalis]|uniref:Dephospho-CoA kinase domain-containing protein-like n=1 Tax=Thamnophis sirtalis TaxID=35019 RepID=A0A6I9Z7P5_9SAUR|nr:PREDICTED: dephospho-CoA kinase domain-containing protein-like [Thamnophis sirtalis]